VSSCEVLDFSVDLKPRAATIVSVCVTCRASAGEEPRIGTRMHQALAPTLNSSAPDVIVRAVQCLGVCKRPATVSVSAPDGYTFVFGDLDPASGPQAIARFVQLYREADYGFVPWAQRPDLLRTRLVARIPSAEWSPDDGRPPA
jgi:predicted metal-binding protein